MISLEFDPRVMGRGYCVVSLRALVGNMVHSIDPTDPTHKPVIVIRMSGRYFVNVDDCWYREGSTYWDTFGLGEKIPTDAKHETLLGALNNVAKEFLTYLVEGVVPGPPFEGEENGT